MSFAHEGNLLTEPSSRTNMSGPPGEDYLELPGQVKDARETGSKISSLQGPNEGRQCYHEIGKTAPSYRLEPIFRSGNETHPAGLLKCPKPMNQIYSPCSNDIVKDTVVPEEIICEIITEGKEKLNEAVQIGTEVVQKGTEVAEETVEKGSEYVNIVVQKGSNIMDQAAQKGSVAIKAAAQIGGEAVEKGEEAAKALKESLMEKLKRLIENYPILKSAYFWNLSAFILVCAMLLTIFYTS